MSSLIRLVLAFSLANLYLMARKSHLSGCCQLFAPQFWEMLCGVPSGGGDTQTLPYFAKNLFELFALTGSGDTKTSQSY